MKNVTISIDDRALALAKEAAAKKGLSLNKFVGELIERAVGCDDRQSEAEFLNLFAEIAAKVDFRGWKWNRDEIYEDAI